MYIQGVMKLRKIWQIYLTDWRNVFKVSTGTLLVIGIILLPSVYAWVNLKAMWDPYANTSGIKIAVTSQDQGAEVNGKKINIGDEVCITFKITRSWVGLLSMKRKHEKVC